MRAVQGRRFTVEVAIPIQTVWNPREACDVLAGPCRDGADRGDRRKKEKISPPRSGETPELP